jgi:predicted outer membrane repeat protein
MKAGGLALLAVLWQLSAFGSGVVTICTEEALRGALAGGGTVTFDCDGTIALSNTVDIVESTILDASPRRTTISGGARVRLFNVAPGVSLKLVNLTLADGAAIGSDAEGSTQAPGFIFPENAQGGAIAATNATIVIESCVVSNNMAKGGDSYLAAILGLYSGVSESTGGAIALHGGELKVSSSRFVQNIAQVPHGRDAGGMEYEAFGIARGGAIAVEGCRVAITNSTFVGNKAGTPGGGGIYAADSTVQISEGAFEGNSAPGNGAGRWVVTPPGAGRGGALLLTNSPSALSACSFTGNVALGGTTYRSAIEVGQGGAVYSNEELTITNSSFVGNASGGNAAGGAVYSGGPAKITRTRFVGNAATGASVTANGAGQAGPGDGLGGAIASSAPLRISEASFVSNSVSAGLVFASVTILSPTIGRGGALYGTDSLYATNVTVALNQGSGLAATNVAGSGFYLSGLTNVITYGTLATNRISFGVQEVKRSFEQAIVTGTNGGVSIHATILSGGSSNLLQGNVTDAGYNISSDRSLTNTQSRNSVDARLRAPGLSKYGIETMPLMSGSPAIDTGDPTQFPLIDARGELRPFGSAVDIGAFEYRDSDSQAVLSISWGADGGLDLTSFDDAVRGMILEKTTNFELWQNVLTNGPAVENRFRVEPKARSEFFRLRLSPLAGEREAIGLTDQDGNRN